VIQLSPIGPNSLLHTSSPIAAVKRPGSAGATWTANDHPDDYREQTQRWDRLHYARVAIIIAAFVLTVVAATVR
jgi:hypothetical protein